ncbi:LacI family DNA-binding transcriptional regulator [Actibacterium sp. 188UL27-1]|uniref:LacI family DNA-binding transcriptional regulator n=1 Tax=Actibacterium sp. 188UL27-1 TaxID=2786961 RepID=UPI00195CA238|nr:LacI family DNA-binding transcriptional regulator [Actibacterium sp. 188UL27-1]MBM7069172.1 LacI family DNA-binding transcriptional regulator [Actibacterium sp. 188UL27-1]
MTCGKVTSVDVARATGVSQPTVGRVFASDARVSPAMRARMMEAATALGYRHNTLVRAMITGRSNIIGLVVAYLENPFYAEAIERFSTCLKARGYHALLVTASNDENNVDSVVKDIMGLQVAGMILASISATLSLTRELDRPGIPLVLFNRGQEDAMIPKVTAANFEGGRKTAHLLVRRGHKRIAHVSGWQGSLTGLDRMNGFLAGLADPGQTPVACIDSHYDRDHAKVVTRQVFATPDCPDAVFVGNDHMAFAVMEVLRHELALDIPGDVSIIGYDDVKMAAWQDFNMTTLCQPANRMVDATVDMLMQMISGAAMPVRHVKITSELIERGTTRDRTKDSQNDQT